MILPSPTPSCGSSRPSIVSGLPNLNAIFSIGAGVDHILADRTVPDVPIVKVVADNLTKHMTEYVVWRVLDHHRFGQPYRSQQQRRSGARWGSARPTMSRSASWVSAASAATRPRCCVARISRQWMVAQRRPMKGVATFAGEAGLIPIPQCDRYSGGAAAADGCHPGHGRLRLLKELRRRNALGGSVLINAGRGRLQKDDDILRALEDGTLKEASLDVFEVEPLPKTSALWTIRRSSSHRTPPRPPILCTWRRSCCARWMPSSAASRSHNLVDRKAGY